MLCSLAEVTCLLESSSELIRTLEQVNLSLREGKSLDISIRTLEAIARLKAQLESLLQGRKWRNAVERIWAFGPRRCDTNLNGSGSHGTYIYVEKTQGGNFSLNSPTLEKIQMLHMIL